MNFMQNLKTELDNKKTLTENGALAYETTGKQLLDFSFSVPGLRNATEDEIKREFSKAYFEDPMTAIKYLFWLRDCRKGNGERRTFRVCTLWLAENKPEVLKAVINLIPEYGRWDDLWTLLESSVKEKVAAVVVGQLADDVKAWGEGKEVSLLGKWMPSENASSAKTKKNAETVMKYLQLSPRKYRVMLSKLRDRIDVVERKMSSKHWSEIDYGKVPSVANVKYKEAFLRNDKDRRSAYLESLVKGEAKINAGVLQPHDIVHRYSAGGWYADVKDYDETLEQLWKSLPDMSIENALVVRDGSGSMTSHVTPTVTALEIATALTIYMAEHNNGIWKNKFLTFSSRPKLIDVGNCKNLHDKLVKTYVEDDCSNTDIEATMMVVLNTAIQNHLTQDEMPKRIIIVSDMQFDAAIDTRYGNEALFDGISKRFEDAGYLMPKICFWNLFGDIRKTIPMQQNKLGVVLASGFSTQIMNMFMSGETDPYKVLLETINADRYQPVEDAVREVI